MTIADSTRRQMCLSFAAMICTLAGGCATMHGNPTRHQETVAVVSAINLTSKDLADLIGAADHLQRNAVIDKAMSVIDLNYFAFSRELQSNRQDANAWASYASLGFNSAGTLVSAVAAKTNYAAAAAVTSGALGITERHYYFDKTVPALVAAMDASRASVELQIREDMRSDISEYSGARALKDLESYYASGSLLAAVNQISSQSKVLSTEAQKDIRKLTVISEDALKSRMSIREAIGKIKDVTKANQALKVLGLDKGDVVIELPAAIKKILEHYRELARSGKSLEPLQTAVTAAAAN